MKLVAIPTGHTDTTLTRALDHLTTAFSTVRQRADYAITSKGTLHPDTDSNARSHDCHLFKSMLVALTDFVQSRLLSVIGNIKRLIDSLLGAFIRHHTFGRNPVARTCCHIAGGGHPYT